MIKGDQVLDVARRDFILRQRSCHETPRRPPNRWLLTSLALMEENPTSRGESRQVAPPSRDVHQIALRRSGRPLRLHRDEATESLTRLAWCTAHGRTDPKQGGIQSSGVALCFLLQALCQTAYPRRRQGNEFCTLQKHKKRPEHRLLLISYQAPRPRYLKMRTLSLQPARIKTNKQLQFACIARSLPSIGGILLQKHILCRTLSQVITGSDVVVLIDISMI